MAELVEYLRSVEFANLIYMSRVVFPWGGSHMILHMLNMIDYSKTILEKWIKRQDTCFTPFQTYLVADWKNKKTEGVLLKFGRHY